MKKQTIIVLFSVLLILPIFCVSNEKFNIPENNYAIIRINYKYISGTVRTTEEMIRKHSIKVILIKEKNKVEDLLKIMNNSKKVDSKLFPRDLFAVIDIVLEKKKYTFLCDRWNFQNKESQKVYKNPGKFLENYIEK